MSTSPTGKRTLTLEIDALDFEAIDRADVGQILRDALGEFLSARGVRKSSTQGEPCAVAPHEVEPYVERRYVDNTERFRRNKVSDVAKRCTAAMALRRASVTFYAHDEPIDPFSHEVEVARPDPKNEPLGAPSLGMQTACVRAFAHDCLCVKCLAKPPEATRGWEP